jgi:type II secretory pathway pseudopilin PulG
VYLGHRRGESSVDHSSFIIHRSARRAYTLVELFLTLAVLMIVLGLMMNLANRVRHESADKLTRQVLAQLTTLMDQYQKSNNQLPAIPPVIAPGEPANEAGLQLRARQNNADFVRVLNLPAVAKSGQFGDDSLAESFGTTDKTAGLLQDPWGSPIVFMPQQNPAIGMAPLDAFFFVSAGPDRQFLTHDDNVYSYEGGNAER